MSVTHSIDDDNIGSGASAASHDGKAPKLVQVSIDDHKVRTDKHTTARALLVLAGLDPSRRRLVKVRGKHQTTYTDIDAELEVHEGDQFVTVSTGSTPVS